MKLFPFHKRIKKKNLQKFYRKLKCITQLYDENKISYDTIYDFMEGWIAYAKQANTYNLRKNILDKYEDQFNREISSKEMKQRLLSKC